MDANKADSMIKDSCNYNLLRHNTFGMNVKCARFLEFSTIDDLREITSQRDIVDKPMLILGGGSNVLFVGDFPGTILHSGIKGIELIRDEDTVAQEKCGMMLLIMQCQQVCMELKIFQPYLEKSVLQQYRI